jgi:hypothetical protein
MIFMSYSSKEEKKWVDVFSEDLAKEVRDLFGRTEYGAVFVDRLSISTGEDWNERIEAEIYATKVLICLFSPNYFKKGAIAPNYCAKEVFTFINRYPEPRFGESRGKKAIIGINNIIPILWRSEGDLKAIGLPPPLFDYIHYKLKITDQKMADKYLQLGLNWLTRQKGPTYRAIVTYFARTIRDRIISNEGSSTVSGSTRKGTAESTFFVDGDELSTQITGAAQEISRIISSSSGPQRIIVIETAKNEIEERQLLRNALHTSVYFEKIRTDFVCFDFREGSFSAELSNALTEATNSNCITIVTIDCDQIVDTALTLLHATLAGKLWTGGVLLMANKSATTASLRSDFASFGAGRISVRSAALSESDRVQTEFRSLVADVTQKILATGQVLQDVPQNGGPEHKPLLQNVTSSSNV